jgi:hypothetical protein
VYRKHKKQLSDTNPKGSLPLIPASTIICDSELVLTTCHPQPIGGVMVICKSISLLACKIMFAIFVLYVFPSVKLQSST